MHYKQQLYAFIMAMVLCAAAAAALGSCGSDRNDDPGGDHDGGDAGTDAGPPTTIAQVTDRLIGCGFTGIEALTRLLETDFSVAREQADGVVFSKSAQAYYEKVASAYLRCVATAPCAELVAFYCGGTLPPAEDGGTLGPCLAAVEVDHARDAPGATFKCTDGTVLDDPAGDVCNGIPDCPNESDETPKACAAVKHIECDGKAVPDEWRCNSRAQCSDGADEQNCFVCSEDETTRTANRCNGREDCGSGADERDCGEPFACPAPSAMDGGAMDGGTHVPEDAGDAGDAGEPRDAGDAGISSDAGTRPTDAGTRPSDAGRTLSLGLFPRRAPHAR